MGIAIDQLQKLLLMHKNERLKKGLLISFSFILCSIAAFIFIKNKELAENGKFVVAVIDGVGSSKSGPIYHAHYFFGKKRFDKRFTGIALGLQKGNYVLAKVSSKHPNIFFEYDEFLDLKIPSCFSISQSPENGWKKLPIDFCATGAGFLPQ